MTAAASMFDRVKEELDLLNRHIEMLKVTKEHQPIGIIRLSEVLGMPKHKVRYSLKMLENEGLIVATTEGAMLSEGYVRFMDELPSRMNELREQLEVISSTLE